MHWYCLSFFVNCKTSPPIVINKGRIQAAKIIDLNYGKRYS